MAGNKTRKTVDRYRDAGTGRLLTDEQGKKMPKDKVVKERIPKPGNGIGD